MDTKSCRMLRYRATVTFWCRKSDSYDSFRRLTGQIMFFGEYNNDETKRMRIFLSRKSPVLLMNKAGEVKIGFVRKANASYIHLVTIDLIKQAVREDISLTGGSGMEKLTSLNFVWKQVWNFFHDFTHWGFLNYTLSCTFLTDDRGLVWIPSSWTFSSVTDAYHPWLSLTLPVRSNFTNKHFTAFFGDPTVKLNFCWKLSGF